MCSRPSFATVVATHRSSPYGRPRRSLSSAAQFPRPDRLVHPLATDHHPMLSPARRSVNPLPHPPSPGKPADNPNKIHTPYLTSPRLCGIIPPRLSTILAERGFANVPNFARRSAPFVLACGLPGCFTPPWPFRVLRGQSRRVRRPRVDSVPERSRFGPEKSPFWYRFGTGTLCNSERDRKGLEKGSESARFFHQTLRTSTRQNQRNPPRSQGLRLHRPRGPSPPEHFPRATPWRQPPPAAFPALPRPA